VVTPGILAAVVVLASGSAAAEGSSTYQILGAGADGCTEWTDFKRQQDPARYGAIAWMLGYISAFNNYVFPDGNVNRAASVDDMVAWMDAYCELKPDTTIAAATDALIHGLASAKPATRK
jgi:hypothetical protein